MKDLLAQTNPFGNIQAPQSLSNFAPTPTQAIGQIIQFAIYLLISGAGLYALFNIIFAGYSFFSAGDDSKKVSSAWAQIYQTILGIAVVAGSFVIAALIGKVLFNDSLFLLRPRLILPF